MGMKQTGRATSRTVEFNELFEQLNELKEASGLSFADVVRLMIREGMKSEMARQYLGKLDEHRTASEPRGTPRQRHTGGR